MEFVDLGGFVTDDSGCIKDIQSRIVLA